MAYLLDKISPRRLQETPVESSPAALNLDIPLASGLLAYYPCIPGNGTGMLDDFGPYAFHARTTNTQGAVANYNRFRVISGMAGIYAVPYGILAFPSTGRTTLFDFGGGVPFTVMCWVYMYGLPAATSRLVHKQSTNTGWDLQIFQGKALFEYGTGTTLPNFNTGGNLPLNKWHQVCISYNGSVGTLYLNASNAVSSTFTIGAALTTDLSIGPTSFDMTSGQLAMTHFTANVLIYNRALNINEISYLYQDPYVLLRGRRGIAGSLMLPVAANPTTSSVNSLMMMGMGT